MLGRAACGAALAATGAIAPLTPLGAHAADAPSGLPAPVLLPGTHVAHVAPAGAVTVSPEPGSRTADPLTQISFLGRPLARLGTITVVGSQSGRHGGVFRAYSTGTGASFLLHRPFVAGETVTVHTSLPIAGAVRGTFSFHVAHTEPLSGDLTVPPLKTDVAGVQHFASAPHLDPPKVTVRKNALAKGGAFFLAPKGSTGRAGPMIVAPDGQLVWFRPLSGSTIAFGLNVQRYEGKPVLTWFQGTVLHSHGEGVAIIANEHYRTIATVHAGNGVAMDLHELQITPQGTAVVTAYRTMRWDTRSAGGVTSGLVFDGVVQEIDIKTGLVMMEWDSLDHVPVSASNFAAPRSARSYFDYFHINGIQPLARGDFLVSSRNTSAAYEIAPASDGAILLTLGGKHPSVRMGRGTRFWYEHDVELRPGDRVTLFDNGAGPAREKASRALTLQLDVATRSVHLVRALTFPGVLAPALGNVQLTTTHEIVGWGTAPNYSVYNLTGKDLYTAALPNGDNSYRAYFHSWIGRPDNPPSVARVRVGAALKLSMSWNGETGIARWRVLTGSTKHDLHPAVTVRHTGFENHATLEHPSAVVRVQALARSGAVLGSTTLRL